MATYIPGVEDKIPQSQPFVPDYKFLSDVLQVRQDRYDKNYKQLNDVYGKVVYADLTRDDNKYIRDQYANQLAPQIKQISGLDLSLQSNVDAAYGLFRPFYENEQIIKDLTATTTLKNERKKAASFKDSPIRQVREKYWDYGIQGLDIWEENFKNADPQKALTMGLPTYIDDVDLVEQAEMLLDQSDLGDKSDVFISQDNKWIVKQKSGSLITSAPTGNIITIKTKEGKELQVPETKNLALDYVKNRLMDDPKVQAAYHLRNFVDMTNYVKENSEAMGGDDAAKKEWIKITQEKYTPKLESEIIALNGIKEEKKLEVASWESYAKSIGIKPGSQDDIDYLNSLDQLKLVEETSQGQTDKLKDVTAPTSDLKDLLVKTYTLAMGVQMGTDMLTAASSYANKTMTRDMDPNPVYTKWIEHQYAMQRIKYKESIKNAKENKENVENPSVSLYRRKQGNDKNLAGDIEVAKDNIEGVVDKTKNIFGIEVTTNVTDGIKINQETYTNEVDESTSRMKDIIRDVYNKNAGRLGLDPSRFTPIFSNELMIGDRKEQQGTIVRDIYGNTLFTSAPDTSGYTASGGIGVDSDSTINDMSGTMNIPTDITEENVAYYPTDVSMSWDEFENIDNPALIESMYMNLLHKLDNAQTQFPSFLEMNTNERSELFYNIQNVRGNMTDFVLKTDELAANYMDVQKHLIGVDPSFKSAASDGGSIFSKDGVLIPLELFQERYVNKWTQITRSEIPNVNDPLVTGDWDQDMNMGHFGTTPSTYPQYNPEGNIPSDTIPQFSGHQVDSIAGDTSDFEYTGPIFQNAMGGRYWSIPAGGGSMQDMYGNQLYSTPEPQYSRMYSDAEEMYTYMYNQINKTMSETGDNAAEFGYNLDASLEGMPSNIGQGMYSSANHQFKYDENSSMQLNSPAVDFANQIFEILDGDDADYSVIAGGNYLAEEGASLGKHNPQMEWLINEIYMEMTDNYGKPKDDGGGAPKTDGLGFTIAYSKNGAGVELDAALYEITVTNDWLTKKLGTANADGVYVKGKVTTTDSKEFFEDNTITILIEKEVDHNIYKTGKREERWVMQELNANNGVIERIIPGGGNIKIYELRPGQYMYSDSYWSIVDGEKVLVPNLNLQVPQYKIAELLQTQFEKMNEIAGSNLDLTKSYNVANNFIE